jgi:hypothetical protein
LKKLLMMEKKIASIIITNRTGARDIDFKFSSPAVILIGFLPDTKADFLRCVGRSSRNAFLISVFAICARTSLNIRASNVFAYYDQVKATQLASLKQKVLIKCASLMQKASIIINTPFKTWNSLTVWECHISLFSKSQLKSELRRIERLKDLLREE